MHPKMKKIFVGVDTHRHTHTAVIINCFNEKLDEITFDNGPSAFEAFLWEVNSHAKKGNNPGVRSGGYRFLRQGFDCFP